MSGVTVETILTQMIFDFYENTQHSFIYLNG